MIKVDFKTYIFKISLILVLVLSAVTCVYAVWNYQGNNNIVQINQSNNFNFSQDFQKPNGDNQKQNDQANGKVMLPGEGEPPEDNQSKYSNVGEESENNETQSSNLGEQSGSNQNQLQGEGRQPKDNQITNGGDQSSGNKSQPPRQHGGNMNGEGAGNKYFYMLNIYSGMFLVLCLSIYYFCKHKKIEISLKDEKLLIFTLLAVGFLLRIAASTLMDGYIGDVNLFRSWADAAAKGFSDFYANARQADYPPLYIYVLGFIGKVVSIFNLKTYYVLMLKMPSIITEVITCYLIYKLSKKYFSSIVSVLLGAFYIFNPAIFIDSVFWGQVDSFFTLLIVVAIYLLCEKKYVLSSVIFAISILMKPQGIIFLPILFIELVRQKKIKNFIFCGISALITALIIIIPFSLKQESPLWIINLYIKTISEYQYASVNAFNFFALIGGNYKDYNTELFIMSYHTMGMIFIVITTLIGWLVYIKGNDRKYISAIALLQIAGVFTFSVGMHERYLFPAVALSILAFIYLKDRRFFILAVGFSITSYINIATILFNSHGDNFNNFLKGTAILNVLLVAYLLKVLLDNIVEKINKKGLSL